MLFSTIPLLQYSRGKIIRHVLLMMTIFAYYQHSLQHLVFLIHGNGLTDAANVINIYALPGILAIIAAELQDYLYDQRTFCSPQEAHSQAL